MTKTRKWLLAGILCLALAASAVGLTAPRGAEADASASEWALADYYLADSFADGSPFAPIYKASAESTLNAKPMRWQTDQYVDGGNLIFHGDHCSHGAHSDPDNVGIHSMPGENNALGIVFTAPYAAKFTFTYRLSWAFYPVGGEYGGAYDPAASAPKPEFDGVTASLETVTDGKLSVLKKQGFDFAKLTGEGNQWKQIQASAQLKKGDLAYFMLDSDNADIEGAGKNWWDNCYLDLSVARSSVNSKSDFPSEYNGQNNLWAMWGKENSFDDLSADHVRHRPSATPPDYQGGGLQYAFVQPEALQTDRGIAALMYKAPAAATYRVTYEYWWNVGPSGRGGNGAKFGIGTLKGGTLAKVGTEAVLAPEDLCEGGDLAAGASKLFSITEEVSLAYGEGVFVYVDSNGDGGWDNYGYSMDVEAITEGTVEVAALNYESGSGEVGVGDRISLVPTVGGGSTELVVWSSSDEGVATVENGVVTGVSAGAAQITAAIGNSAKSLDVTVIGGEIAAVIAGGDSVQANKALQLTLEVTGAQGEVAQGYTVEWSSSRPGIAAVDDTGKVSGIAEGEAEISALVDLDGAKALAKLKITVTPGVRITIEGSTFLVAGGDGVTLTAKTENTTETEIVWESLTPEVTSVTAEGVVTGLKFGYGVVSATVDGATAYHAFTVQKSYGDEDTTWDFYDQFPMEQGENNFTVVYGPSGDPAEDPGYLTLLSILQCVRSTDVPSGAPQQWKGGSQYATLAQSFIMPGDGTMGFLFAAPVAGNYRVNLTLFWNMAARGQITGAEDAAGKGFDGATVGFAVINEAGDAATVKFSKLMDYAALTGVATEKLMEELNVTLAEGEKLLFFADGHGDGGWDQYDYTVKIANPDYTGPIETDEKPTVTTRTFTFDRAAASDVVIEVALKGKSLTGLKLGEDLIAAEDYTVSEGKITLKKEYLSGLADGLKTVTIVTEGGTCEVKITVSGTPKQPETGCGCGGLLLSSGGGTLGGGLLLLAAAVCAVLAAKIGLKTKRA